MLRLTFPATLSVYKVGGSCISSRPQLREGSGFNKRRRQKYTEQHYSHTGTQSPYNTEAEKLQGKTFLLFLLTYFILCFLLFSRKTNICYLI